MASSHRLPASSKSALLAAPLEIRRHIYSFCIPQRLTFDCSGDMYYQNRLVGWIEPPWRSDEGCCDTTGAGLEEESVDEIRYLRGKWSANNPLSPIEEIEDVLAEGTSSDGGGGGGGGVDYGVKEQFGVLERDNDYFSDPSTRRSALPALLLLCRQITNEVEAMLYDGNTFVVDNYYPCEHLARQFTKRKQARMRNMILVLRPFLPNPFTDRDTWDPVLGNLLTLGIIIEQPEPPLLEWLRDSGKWPDYTAFLREKKREAAGKRMASLAPVFEYLVRAVPEHAEVVLDVAEEEEGVVQTLGCFQEGRLRFRFCFRRLPVADSITNGVEFAWESESRESWSLDYDEGSTGCGDTINESDYDYCYSE
ncbi:hypothetical protein F5Y14DRAFT_434488 [Nemania sp. NC0429]|nr:hypothetical protein F5Y14DRAFT_434488 [Nemania sp. NC0429]